MEFIKIDGVNDMKLTRTQTRLQVIRLAKSLSNVFGVKEGDVIGLYCENRLELPVIVFAAFCLGATIAPINVTYTDRKSSHLLAVKFTCNYMKESINSK